MFYIRFSNQNDTNASCTRDFIVPFGPFRESVLCQPVKTSQSVHFRRKPIYLPVKYSIYGINNTGQVFGLKLELMP